eukprot:GHVR01119642.1.p1 GENE.GHVR01119642.1~~GHVR01119642.1.p1  ORF type:complete len:438 (-),score=94.53 GHVR01119642.1:48-1361(-)
MFKKESSKKESNPSVSKVDDKQGRQDDNVDEPLLSSTQRKSTDTERKDSTAKESSRKESTGKESNMSAVEMTIKAENLSQNEKDVQHWIDSPKKIPELVVYIPRAVSSCNDPGGAFLVSLVPLAVIAGVILLVLFSELISSTPWLEEHFPIWALLIEAVGVGVMQWARTFSLGLSLMDHIKESHEHVLNSVRLAAQNTERQWVNLDNMIQGVRDEYTPITTRANTLSSMGALQNGKIPNFKKIDNELESGRELLIVRFNNLMSDIQDDQAMYLPWGYTSLKSFVSLWTAVYIIFVLVQIGVCALIHSLSSWPHNDDVNGPLKQVLIISGGQLLVVIVIGWFSGPSADDTIDAHLWYVEKTLRDEMDEEMEDTLRTTFVDKAENLAEHLKELMFDMHVLKDTLNNQGDSIGTTIAGIGGGVHQAVNDMMAFFRKNQQH